MRIADKIYFSPSLRLEMLDLNNKNQLIENFNERITKYFIEPIEALNHSENAFAAGSLLTLLIDALSRYTTTENGSEKRMVKWCIDNLKVDKSTGTMFYEHFRCGLLHESHIKSLGQFTYDIEFAKSMTIEKNCLIVNPKCLFDDINKYFDEFIQLLKKDDSIYQIFLSRIKIDFEQEINTLLTTS